MDHEEDVPGGLGGERVKGTDAGGNVYLEGFRCASCRILSLRY